MQLEDVTIAVCERRREGIRRLMLDPKINLVLLDDAYQHRYVRPDCRVLLTTFDKPWSEDHLLPAGHLREPASSARRADIVVVTKCPENLDKGRQLMFMEKLGLKPVQELFFSSIRYRELLSGLYGGTFPVSGLVGKRVLLFCGIADPSPLQSWLNDYAEAIELKRFPDHHAFTVSDLVQLRKTFDRLSLQGPSCVITTRKDAMRLQEREARVHLESLPVWIVDMEPEFIPLGQRPFEEAILSRVRRNPS
jgi:tetraacyldisaccharide 4'-kinase